MRAASLPGQVTPAPSPAQKIPKAVSIAPTAYFMVFSGTRLKGRCTNRPNNRTMMAAAPAPAAARASRCWAAPKVTTMKAISRPSRNTPLNETVKLYQSMPDPERAADLDAAFHHAIAVATRNHVLVKLVETSMELLNQTRRRHLQTPERRRMSLDAHRAILAAIEAHDGEAAGQAMTDHIRGVAASVMRADGEPRPPTPKGGGTR